jgi:hypothetical protein
MQVEHLPKEAKMKKFLRILSIAIALMLVLAATLPAAAAPPNPFTGAWESTDSDGSYQLLTIGGGPAGTHHTRYYDFGASVCGLDPVTHQPIYAASATGTLTEAGNNQVSGSFQVICQARPPYPLPYLSQLAYTYQPATDTLIDIWGVTWTRK